ncbi:MAG TPA: polyprenyl synthetase family protein, partial [Spongiibacteraceae bacterium]|nr:polyprenyl synthetase family protein [Spongiibacteraceae bacterium]
TKAGDPETTEAAYFTVIESKTAVLFAAATKGAALLHGATTIDADKLYRYGLYLGTAFQLADDLLDYLGDPQKMGKNIGDDLSEGKPTLPLIFTIKAGTAAERQLVIDAIAQRDPSQIEAITKAVIRCGALDYTREQALRYADLALAELSTFKESDCHKALIDLCQIAVQRDR